MTYYFTIIFDIGLSVCDKCVIVDGQNNASTKAVTHSYVFPEEDNLNPTKRSKEQSRPTQIDILRMNNDKLKQELRTSNEKFVEELDTYKATVNTLETTVDKLRKELQMTKAGTMYVGN